MPALALYMGAHFISTTYSLMLDDKAVADYFGYLHLFFSSV
jgi:hypothetical protein